ncbi:hypothetical protein AURDEDRAFT_114132 [Auricularia subglabra TFB-10046 SS5]|nr:hypothetical protein AURDEDRAFT_114132 [Auricularia subglabra TFB-10046 SS5]
MGVRSTARRARSAWRQLLPSRVTVHRAGVRTHAHRRAIVYRRYLSNAKRRKQADIDQVDKTSLPVNHYDDKDLYLELYRSPAGFHRALPQDSEDGDPSGVRAASPPGDTLNLALPTAFTPYSATVPNHGPEASEQNAVDHSLPGRKTGGKSALHKKARKTKVDAKTVTSLSSLKMAVKKTSTSRQSTWRKLLLARSAVLVDGAGRRMITHHLGLGIEGNKTNSQEASLQKLRAENSSQKALIECQAETIRRLIAHRTKDGVPLYD